MAFIAYPSCFGDREQAWDECEKCSHIMACSIKTLTREFGDRAIIVHDEGSIDKHKKRSDDAK